MPERAGDDRRSRTRCARGASRRRVRLHRRRRGGRMDAGREPAVVRPMDVPSPRAPGCERARPVDRALRGPHLDAGHRRARGPINGSCTPTGTSAPRGAPRRPAPIACLSSSGFDLLDGIVAASDGPKWWQLYVSADRGFTAEMLARVAAGGFGAIVWTVDLPVYGIRRRDERNAFEIPDELVPAGFGNDGAIAWDDLPWIREQAAGLPVLVKGILTPEDAELALRAGADGIVVSNHGGRQLDSSIPALGRAPRRRGGRRRPHPRADGRRGAVAAPTSSRRWRSAPRRSWSAVRPPGVWPSGEARASRTCSASSGRSWRTRWPCAGAGPSRRSGASSSSPRRDAAQGVWQAGRSMPGFDLHTHSTYSDGTATPAENVRLAIERGLEGIAVTDHDTTGGYADAFAAAEGTVAAGRSRDRVQRRIRGRVAPRPGVLGRSRARRPAGGAPAAERHPVPARRADGGEAPGARLRRVLRTRPRDRRRRPDRAASSRAGDGRSRHRADGGGGVRSVHLRRRDRVRAEARPRPARRAGVDRRGGRRLRPGASRHVAGQRAPCRRS